MFKIILILSLLLFFCCIPPRLDQGAFATANIKGATPLVRMQTSIYNRYKAGEKIPQIELDSLETNLWVKTAEKVAPSNIVVRQYALIDILKGKPSHKADIHHLINCLSGGEKLSRVWQEGYSYFIYTRDILDEWMRLYKDDMTQQMITETDLGFICTAYFNPDNNLWYPAPFGDLANTPLSPELQEMSKNKNQKPSSCIVSNVTLTVSGDSLIYKILAKPLGMNIHLPKVDQTVIVKNGIPLDFVWYVHVTEKYKSDEEEYQDMLDARRVQTIKDLCK